MNRSMLLVLALVSLATGSTGLVLGSMYIERLRPSAGSVSEPDPEYQRIPVDADSPWMTGFTLTERSGNEVRWSDLQGKVVVTSFFFSSCPALCLQQNQKVGELQRAYAGKDVAFLSITCDPDIDTPSRLREYASKLNAHPSQWLFLTGDLTYIRRVAGELFGVVLDKQTHSERLLVADKWGNIRGSFHWNRLDEVTQLKQLVEKLLAETEEPAEFVQKKKEQAEQIQRAAATNVEQASSVPKSEAAPSPDGESE